MTETTTDLPNETGPATEVGYVLAVDLGTGGPKVALVSTDGTVVGHEYETNQLILLPGGGAEQDPDEWIDSITTAAHRLLDRELVDRSQIVAVSVTAQWMGTVAVDGEGRHLANAIIWMDARGARQASAIAGGGVEVPTTGYNARKLRTWLTMTGGLPSRTGKDPVGHILWLAHERPEIYAAAHTFLDVPDYLNLRLTGRACASYDSVVGLWCTDNRDLAAVTYRDELIELSGIDAAKLPELVPTGSIVGPLKPELAAEFGVGDHVVVVTGTGDTASAGIGSGAVRDYDAHLYIGTSSWLSCHVPFKKTDIFSNITSLPSGIPNRYWVATEQDVAGKALQWLIDSVLYPDDELGTGPAPDDVFDRLNILAESVPPGANGVIFTPWLNGERTPVDNHLIRSMWFNLGLESTRADLVRAVFEGVALNTRWMMEAAEKFIRKQRPDGFEHITFVGGGARSSLWCQIHADVLDRPIRQVADPVLANARGAAFSAAVALGHLRWEDIPAKIEITETFLPNPDHRATYDRAFAAFVDLYKQNKSGFARLNRSRRHG
jgi:xylulokinase